MSEPVDQPHPFPGPDALGRGVVIGPGQDVPEEAIRWPVYVVDDDVLAKPADAVVALDRAWRTRQPSVIELHVPLAALKSPESSEDPPHALEPEFAFWRERLHFLVWANRYDARNGSPRWPHTRRAHALGATLVDPEGRAGDVTLPQGPAAWIDGGPRAGVIDLPDGLPVVHMNQVWAGSLSPDRWEEAADDLAPDQTDAVHHAGGPARVLAPAGSGKTRVLTSRLRHLLKDRNWTAGCVTALAYNNRAAAEMRSRTRDLPGAQVQTLHSLGYEILDRARGARPKVLNEREVRRLLDDLVTVRHRANEDVYAPYLEALAEVRAALRAPDTVEAAREDVPGFAGMFDHYRDRLRRAGAIDHDEQIYGAIEVLLRDPEVRHAMQRRCAHLLLDELQDLTPAQLLMVRLVTAPAYDVYGVGDDDQVIYGYAGADPRFLVNYSTFFPDAASFLLEVNYRCPAPVVQAASKLLANNRQRVPKETRAANGGEEPADPEALVVTSPPEERLGERLVEAVEKRLAQGVEPTDIAVLARVNAGLLAPQVLLGEAGIPVEPAVDERMLDRTGTRAALAWLRLISAVRDRHPLDGSDLAVAARRPPRKLRPGVLGALGRGEWPIRRLAAFADGLDDRRMRAGLEGLYRDLDRLGRQARSGKPTAMLLSEVRDSVGLGGALDQLDGTRSSPRGGHVDDLDALILVARARPELAEFEPWLRATLRGPAHPGEAPINAGTAARPNVTLSTIHRVKGLEWPHVIVWDASDGVMPHHLNRTGPELEEERRVFHVALTRARSSVTVLARAGMESPFLAEMAGMRRPPRHDGDSRSDQDPTPGTRSSARAPDTGLAGRLEALKAWRRTRAETDGVPAFVVLNDRHLEGIAKRAPASLDELAACDGIGPTKLDRYGEDILAVLSRQGSVAGGAT